MTSIICSARSPRSLCSGSFVSYDHWLCARSAEQRQRLSCTPELLNRMFNNAITIKVWLRSLEGEVEAPAEVRADAH